MEKPKNRHVTLKIDTNNKKVKESYPIKSVFQAYFPYQPYPEQIFMVSLIQQSIAQGKNALIEAPTGAGKTLTLLVGALSALKDSKIKKSKIFYLTRTHSQINQVIGELKKTPYECKLNIIGSRQHMCINANILQLKGRALDKACHELCAQKLCHFKDFSETKVKDILTLQQYKSLGRKNMFCPYYLSKQSTQKCQLTIMPFNYMLDQKIFEQNNFDLQDSIIIFDEAHNIDNISEQGSSIFIHSQDIRLAVIQVKSLIRNIKSKYLHKKFQYHNSESQLAQQTKQLLENFLQKLKQFNESELYDRNKILETLQYFISYKQFDTFQGIDLENCDQFFSNWKKIGKEFYKRKIAAENYNKLIDSFVKVFQLLKNKSNIEDYSVTILTQGKFKIMSFQCLNASYSFLRIIKNKPRSIILSSGTLGPLINWQEDLGVKFHIQQSISSFINSNQLLTGIISSYNKQKFQFSYNKRYNESQYENLISFLLQIEDKVPNGIVIACSNYQIMEKILKLSLNLKKPIFYQQKNSNINDIFTQYSRQSKKKGAILFIIIRGRFSQGINFNDQLCRCLIVIGVPFLPLKDRKIVEKKAYLEKKKNKQAVQDWYLNQAIKALNQTIGRVIRNKKDYGIILLVDQRFQQIQINKLLPTWFKKCLLQNQDSKQISPKIQNFFSNQSWLKDQHLVQQIFEQRYQKTQTNKRKENKKIFGKNLEELIQFSTPAKTQGRKKKLLLIQDEQQQIKLDSLIKKQDKHLLRQNISIPEISYFIGNLKEQQLYKSVQNLDQHQLDKLLSLSKVQMIKEKTNKRQVLLDKMIKKL